MRFTQLLFQGLLSYADQSAEWNKFVRAPAGKIADATPLMTFCTGPGCFGRLFIWGILWVPATAAIGFGALGLVRIIDLDGANLPLLLLALSFGGLVGSSMDGTRRG